jgi:holo-[acyl-carrier protein] synthase
MILGIGHDIIEIARVKAELAKDGDNFKSEIFTPLEIEYCDAKHYPERHYAARFAAKEALFKAMSVARGTGISWLEIEVQNGFGGEPIIILSGEAFMQGERMGVNRILVSLSHTAELASANVLLES